MATLNTNFNIHTDLGFLVQEILAGTQVSTDSRELAEGSIFFALDGLRFRGAEFVQEALDCGASWVITHEKTWARNPRVCVVHDSLEALQVLAYMYRRALGFSTQFLALSGSNGKTTTKELIREILAQKYKVQATEGNLNNHIGVPLTILAIRPDTQVAIIEMGANHIGEIAQYCRIVLPEFGLITNISKAHIGEFGDEEKIFQAKSELYQHLANRNIGHATVFVNSDYSELLTATENIGEQITYGRRNPKFSAQLVPSSDYFLRVLLRENGQDYLVKTKLVGAYNLENVLAASCVGRYFKVEWPKIIKALENWRPQNLRSQLLSYQGNLFIIDAYNANPQSMRLAVEDFQARPYADEQKVLILGGMRELGQYSQTEHRNIQDYVEQYNWECIFVGEEWEQREFGKYFYNSSQALSYFKSCGFANKLILLKGSRAHKLEIFVDRNG